MTKTLPFKYPTITSWPWTAATFSILENYDNACEWLYSNFIQLFCEQYDSHISLHYLPHTDVFSVCPFFHSALIPRTFLSNFNISIIDFIKFCIDFNYYVYCFVDESYISSTIESGFSHELVIYGYTDDTFKIADFTLGNNQKYAFSTTSFLNFSRAYYSIASEKDEMLDGIGGNGGIFIFSVNKNERYVLNKSLIVTSLKDYISCHNSSDIYRTYNLEKPGNFNSDLRKVIWGINVYNEIYNYYVTLERDNKDFYIQPLHVLYDHKVLMLKRLYYLKEKKIFSLSDNIMKNSTYLVKKTQTLRNLGIKYWICKDDRILKEIGKVLQDLQAIDISMTIELIELLNN